MLITSELTNQSARKALFTCVVYTKLGYRAFSHDVTAAILVFQNNETAAMLGYQTNPLGVELFCYVNTSFCFSKFACVLATLVKTLYLSADIRDKGAYESTTFERRRR